MAGTLRPLAAKGDAAANGLASLPPQPRRGGLLRHAPALTLAAFLLPIGAGLLGTWLPALGYLPALGGNELALWPWHALFAHPSLPGALKLTLLSGVLATVVALALTLACVAGCHGSAVFRHLRRALAPLLSVPHAALAIGLAFLIAPSGWAVRLVSPWASGWTIPPDVASLQDPWGLALALGLVIKEMPFLFLMMLAALDHVQADQRLAIARSLGYGPVTAWLKTVLPAVYPRLRLPIYAVLAFSLSVVDMALILAPLSPPPLAVLVLRWFNDPDLSMRFIAAAGACLQLAVVVAALFAWYGLERLVARLSRPWLVSGKRGGDGRATRLAGGLGAGLVVLLAGAGLLALVLWSIARSWRYPDALPSRWSLGNWGRHDLLWAGGTTLAVGLAAAAIALAMVLACLENERRRGLRADGKSLWLLYLPLLVPQVAFLFGAQVLAVRLGLDGTWTALVWAHLLFVLPYVFLSLAEPYRALDRRYERAALCLGASPNRVFWRVKLPMLLRPILVALAVGFAVSVTQYLPTLFAGGGRFVTLTTEAVGLAAGGDRRVIAVYALMQALSPLIGFALALFLPAWLFRHRRALAGAR